MRLALALGAAQQQVLVTVHEPGDGLIFSARLAFPSASGGGPNNVPLRLGRRGQSHVRGEKGVFPRTPSPPRREKVKQSPVPLTPDFLFRCATFSRCGLLKLFQRKLLVLQGSRR
jgi:hypothetical protein